MSSVHVKQLKLPFGYDHKRTNDLYQNLQASPVAEAVIRDQLTLSAADAEENTAVRLEKAFKEDWSQQSEDCTASSVLGAALTTAGIAAASVVFGSSMGFLTGLAVLAAGTLATAAGVLSLGAGAVMRNAGDFENIFSGTETEKLIADVNQDEALMKRLKNDKVWLRKENPPIQASESETSGEKSLLAKAVGGLNVLRTAPTWLALPLVNTVLPPKNIKEERRNTLISSIATPAVAIMAAFPAVGSSILATAGMTALKGLGLGSLFRVATAGATGTVADIGRKTEAAVADTEPGFERVKASITQGYKEAVKSAYEQGAGFVTGFGERFAETKELNKAPDLVAN